jgi:hypothetical protein
MMNSVVIMNSDIDMAIRKTVVHAVDKGHIINKELGGIEQPVYQLFPEAAPYWSVWLRAPHSQQLRRHSTHTRHRLAISALPRRLIMTSPTATDAPHISPTTVAMSTSLRSLITTLTKQKI